MSDQLTKWDKQWHALLTHCHGETVEADAGFRTSLLSELKARTTENRAGNEAETQDANWGKLMKAAYVPCHPAETFKTGLLSGLKAKQAQAFAATGDAAAPASPATEDEALQVILTKSYQPVAPRKEFETRLLENLKERQRETTIRRLQSRRRTIYLSVASSMAAAALVMFIVWLTPYTGEASPSVPTQRAANNLHLSVPDIAAAPVRPVESNPPSGFDNGFMFASTIPAAAAGAGASRNDGIAPASFVPSSPGQSIPASFASYDTSSVFAGDPLPKSAFALQNVEFNTGQGWHTLPAASRIDLKPGYAFRASNSMGHLRFDNGALVSISPDTLLATTENGLTVDRGFLLVAVPESSNGRFRLHFSERDIAVEPGTDLAVLVESPDNYAPGGAPAPMVMVVDGPDGSGGLALAKGRNGTGPLFARQLYRLDNYVTPDLPGRTLCVTECKDLNELFKMEPVQDTTIPKAFLAGGFAGERDVGNNYSVLLTPAGFTKRGNTWVADSYNGEQTIRIPYLSDAYFGLANQRRDLARELSLGGQVIIDGGDGVFYEISQ